MVDLNTIAGETIIDVFSLDVLERIPKAFNLLTDLIQKIGARDGQVGVALPVLRHSGVAFENNLDVPYDPIKIDKGPGWSLQKLVTELRMAGAETRYLTLTPDMKAFARAAALAEVDSAGDSIRHLCFAKPEVSSQLGHLARFAVEALGSEAAHLSGLAIDICDLLPMGAEGQRVDISCFCTSCCDLLKKHGGWIDYRDGSTQPWRLALRNSGTGISWIGDIRPDDSASDLVEKSQHQGFLNDLPASARLEEMADQLLRYAKARHKITVDTCGTVFKVVNKNQPTLRRIIISENAGFSWTSGSFLSLLDDPEVADELWMEPAETPELPARIDFRPYLTARSRYYLDALGSACYLARSDESLIARRLSQALEVALPLGVARWTSPGVRKFAPVVAALSQEMRAESDSVEEGEVMLGADRTSVAGRQERSEADTVKALLEQLRKLTRT